MARYCQQCGVGLPANLPEGQTTCKLCPTAKTICPMFLHLYRISDTPGMLVCQVCGHQLQSIPISTDVVPVPTPINYMDC